VKKEIKSRIPEVLSLLRKEFPKATIALNYKGVWQLLVAVVLSAQCTDERVNKVTPPLFKRFPTAEDFASCDIEELEKLIYSTGFYRAKAKNLKAAAMRVVEEYGGTVPDKMEDLLTLGGVARKTANVVMNAGYGKSVGVVVDTHVCRIAGLLGWVPMDWSKKKNAIKIEQRLMKILDEEAWGDISYLFILLGRKTCIARRPQCGKCSLNKLCPSSKV
jgi:endonuclease III